MACRQKAILKRIIQYSQPYKLCPCFSLEKVKEVLTQLPDTINPQTNADWQKIGDNISPTTNTMSDSPSINYEIKVNIEPTHISKENYLITSNSSLNTNDTTDISYNSCDTNYTDITYGSSFNTNNSTSDSDINVSTNKKSGCLTTTIMIILIISFLKIIL